MKIVKYGMVGCSACRRLSSVIKMAELDIEEVDIEVEEAKKLNINSVPVIIKYNDEGKEIGRLNGIVLLSKLKEFCN